MSLDWLFFFAFFNFHVFQASQAPKTVAAPVGNPSPIPMPIAILSDVSMPPGDAVLVLLGVAATVDEKYDEVCELAVETASVVLIDGLWSPPLIPVTTVKESVGILLN